MNFLFGFSGRIGRGMWWLAQIVPIMIWVAVILALGGIIKAFDLSAAHEPGELSPGGLALGVAFLIGCIIVVWINLAVCVKRFHDRDKSGWWILINFVPIIGPIWLVVECGFLSGSLGNNSYGPPPGSAGFDSELEAHIGRMKPQRTPDFTVAESPILPSHRASKPLPKPQGTSGKPSFGHRGL